MASQQPNAWQTANRSRNSNSASRTPQNRSGTQSPSQQANPSQPPRQDGGRVQQPPTNNVWTQRSSIVSGSNGPAKAETSSPLQETFQSVNGFNSAEVKAFLSRDIGGITAYKPAEVAATSARNSGGAWGSSNMANNQPFFAQLAKQIATIEGGG